MGESLLAPLTYVHFVSEVRQSVEPREYGFSDSLMQKAYGAYIAHVNKLNVCPWTIQEKKDAHGDFLLLMALRYQSHAHEQLAQETEEAWNELLIALRNISE